MPWSLGQIYNVMSDKNKRKKHIPILGRYWAKAGLVLYLCTCPQYSIDHASHITCEHSDFVQQITLCDGRN